MADDEHQETAAAGETRPLVLELDQSKPGWITCVGRKGSGKSYAAAQFWDSYEGDRMVIDPTGDVDAGDDAESLEAPLPAAWRGRVDGKRSTVRYVPDSGSPTYVDDMDRASGLAFNKGHCLLWLDEIGELTSASHSPPNMRRILRQFRHHDMWVLACDPRTVDLSPLVISQADYLLIFDLPHPRDRERAAAIMGWSPKDFDAALGQIWVPPEGSDIKHTGFLLWDSIHRVATICPPLPPRQRRPEGQRFTPDDDVDEDQGVSAP